MTADDIKKRYNFFRSNAMREYLASINYPVYVEDKMAIVFNDPKLTIEEQEALLSNSVGIYKEEIDEYFDSVEKAYQKFIAPIKDMYYVVEYGECSIVSETFSDLQVILDDLEVVEISKVPIIQNIMSSKEISEEILSDKWFKKRTIARFRNGKLQWISDGEITVELPSLSDRKLAIPHPFEVEDKVLYDEEEYRIYHICTEGQYSDHRAKLFPEYLWNAVSRLSKEAICRYTKDVPLYELEFAKGYVREKKGYKEFYWVGKDWHSALEEIVCCNFDVARLDAAWFNYSVFDMNAQCILRKDDF